MDYFSAALAIIFSLYTAVVRLFHLYASPQLYLRIPVQHETSHPLIPPRHILRPIWGTFCSLLFIGHVLYLSLLPRFNYTYNMIFNVLIALSQNSVWAMYSFRNAPIRRFEGAPKSYLPSYSWKPFVLAVVTIFASSLELFDFPAWKRAIDAHSLWHLATIPIVTVWYTFLIQDATDPSWKQGRL
jgi:post-GPI attachment to proteins factor 3